MLTNTTGYVRSVDVARQIGFLKASVCHAVKELRKRDCLIVENDGALKLTERGNKLANDIYARHKLFTKILIAIGVDAQVAAKDACQIEHVISQESFEKIRTYYQSVCK